MARTAKAIPNPELLVWARRSAAMKLDTAADKLKINTERLNAWEQGEQQPTIAQLRKVGDLYKRPIAVFYLPEAPQLPPHLRDFRRLPGIPDEFDAINIAREARIARERREIFLELAKDVDQPLPEFPHHASLTNNPEQLAQKIRGILHISLHEQTSQADANKIFNFWRNRIEKTGALVFQSTTVDLASMRGFSISEFPLPVIVVNRKDSPRARVFTMVHELVHLLLHIGGACDLDQRPGRPPEEQKIEVFCNHVAGATLVPQNDLLNTAIVIGKGDNSHWHESEFVDLAKHFGVSREVIARRLLILGRINDRQYDKKRKAYQKEHRDFKKSQKKGNGFITPTVNVVSAAGKPYIRTVLGALHADKITLSDVSDYLGIRLKHLSKIEQAVGFG